MASAPAAISVEEFLERTAGERPAPEYVAGEIVERSMPKNAHSAVQAELCVLFGELRRERGIHVRPELHLRVADDQLRVADLAVYGSEPPNAPIPTNPPSVVVEILSPDDKAGTLLEKLRSYSAWGVRHVWLIDPDERTAFSWSEGSLVRAERLEIPEWEAVIETSRLFAELPR